jgi:hypothetical protein
VPELTCGISEGVTRKAVRNWLNRDHKKQESITRCKHTKRASAERRREPLGLNWNVLRCVTGLHTGHGHLKNTFLNWN